MVLIRVIRILIIIILTIVAPCGCSRAEESPATNSPAEQPPPAPSFFTVMGDGSLRAENVIICTSYTPSRSIYDYGLSLVSFDGTRILHLNLDDEYNNVVFSPDGTKIAFANMNVKDCHIFIANADGSNAHMLTPEDMLATEPAFSPDGSKIAFEGYWGKNGIWTINIDGTGLKKLHPSGQDPCFSPDGKKIAYVLWQNLNAEIYIMDADGSDRKRLTRNNMEDFKPVFSPDGSKIVFMSGKLGKDKGINGLGIYSMNVDGTGRRRLTNEDTYDSEPAFSPDGRTIAFATSFGEMAGLNIMNADGTGRCVIAPRTIDFPSSPSFSPMRINGVLYDTYGHIIKE